MKNLFGGWFMLDSTPHALNIAIENARESRWLPWFTEIDVFQELSDSKVLDDQRVPLMVLQPVPSGPGWHHRVSNVIPPVFPRWRGLFLQRDPSDRCSLDWCRGIHWATCWASAIVFLEKPQSYNVGPARLIRDNEVGEHNSSFTMVYDTDNYSYIWYMGYINHLTSQGVPHTSISWPGQMGVTT